MDLIRKMKQNDLILVTLFVVYLISNMHLPEGLNELIDNSIGNIVIILGALILFLNSNPVVGVLGFLVAYELIRRASVSTGNDAIVKYVDTEEKKADKMRSYQPQVPDVSLEEEVIDNMVDFTESDLPPSQVKPVLENSHDAEHLHGDGGEEVGHDHGQHGDQQRAAKQHAQDSVQLGQELGAHQLREHLKRVQRERNAPHRRRQVRLHVRLLAALARGLGRRHGLREDAEVEADLDGLAVLVGGQQEGVVVAELERGARRHPLTEEGVVVALVEDDLVLGEAHVLEDLVQVEGPLADVVVRLKEVEVPRLQHQHQRVLPRALSGARRTGLPSAGLRSGWLPASAVPPRLAIPSFAASSTMTIT